MFRKLVSNLPYSPSLISEVGFYARRLKKEDATRRTALLFVVLTMIFQSLAVFTPPESANASSEQDIIRGGVSSLEDFLARYDNNEEDLKDIYSTAGVVRSEIASAKPGEITRNGDTYIMSRYGQLSAEQKEISMSYPRSEGGTGVRYFSPFSSITSSVSKLDGWVGKSAALGWFGIVKSNGSLATHGIPKTINPESTVGMATKTIEAYNLTQDSADDTRVINPEDKISYTIKQVNTGSEPVTSAFTVRLTDALEYASLIDKGGGTFNSKQQSLSWPDIEIPPEDTEVRTFTVQLFSNIPLTGIGKSNPVSYDCKISVTFGNQVNTPVKCPPIKGMESIFHQLPPAGIALNIGFIVTLLLVVTFFYVRNRHLQSEIKIIRHNFNTGII